MDSSNWTGHVDVSQLCRVCALQDEHFVPIFEGHGLELEFEAKLLNYLSLVVSVSILFCKCQGKLPIFIGITLKFRCPKMINYLCKSASSVQILYWHGMSWSPSIRKPRRTFGHCSAKMMTE